MLALSCRTLATRPFTHLILQKCMRSMHAGTLEGVHPVLRDFTKELGNVQPFFHLQSKGVQILSRPDEFYQHLLGMIGRARRRIFLSSLYIGSAESELINVLGDSLQSNPDLHLYLHLDYNRSTRPEHPSTAVLLLPLLKLYPERVHIYLFKSPKLKGAMAKIVPRRFDEGWGTWHAKIYGVDDEVMISGANLNKSYFTNRQDRYLHFTSPTMAQYCFAFLSRMAGFSFKLLLSNIKAQDGDSPYDLLWSHNCDPQRIEQPAGNSLQDFQKMNMSLIQSARIDESHDVIIFPLIQCGQLGIREEERCFDLLFENMSRQKTLTGSTPHFDITSGYFNLYKRYQHSVINSNADFQILSASPKANGFYGAKDISGRIPGAYTFLEKAFWGSVTQANRQWKDGHGIQLKEWTRDGWTYHAKGVWLSPDKDESPILTLFGSTNLNSRSANLDVELVFVMIPSISSESIPLRIRLGEELAALRKYALPWQGLDRKVSKITKLLTLCVGGML